ncbi:hypothetical protein HMPREF9382_0212 [Streptococcus sanguinis SK115]|uniref:Uncharacterized protein n=1 Tax=Streptococcus sanguinis SK115 TaxID=888810 RepID=F0I5Q8_STRSA|nr:hypothetical protein HMPREF9382_0212 [Streptococcus sanguinis SK115]
MNGLPCKKKELVNQPVLSHIGSLLSFTFQHLSLYDSSVYPFL